MMTSISNGEIVASLREEWRIFKKETKHSYSEVIFQRASRELKRGGESAEVT